MAMIDVAQTGAPGIPACQPRPNHRDFAFALLHPCEDTMPGLLPDIDPDGLLEFSVVYTDRALNHMSGTFQKVMNDISGILKQVYNAHSAIVVPGSGTFRHGSGRAPVCRRQENAGDPQRLVQLPLDADFRDGLDTGFLGGAESAPHRRRSRGAVRASRHRGSGGAYRRRTPRPGVRATRRNRLGHDVAAKLSACGGRCGTCVRWPVRARLHRFRCDLGRYAALWRGCADQCAAEGLECDHRAAAW